jgi:hypothetical protein
MNSTVDPSPAVPERTSTPSKEASSSRSAGVAIDSRASTSAPPKAARARAGPSA